jgi:adenine phosphoribosyltransferase
MSKSIDLEQHILKIPDFPKPGILFYDISTLLIDARAWAETIKRLANKIRVYEPDIIAGIESRGFLLAAPLALELEVGVQMIRKKGKLPGETLSHTYSLEYGQDTLEIQNNSCSACLLELSFLNGRDNINTPFISLINIDE